MYHTEHDFAPVVANYIQNHGMALWEDLRQLIVREFDLSTEDMVKLPRSAYPTRWQSQLNNLGANKTIIRTYNNIVRIDGGFATQEFANEHNLRVIDDGAGGVRERRERICRPRVTRQIVLKMISSFYMNNKNRLRAEIRNHREDIVKAVLEQRPASERVAESLVADEMNKFAVV